MSESPAEPTPQQLIDELRKAKVSDLLVHTSSMLASIAFGKLAPDLRDLEQARLAIEALKAIGPLLDERPRREIQQVVASLQLAYAEASTASSAPAEPPAGS